MKQKVNKQWLAALRSDLHEFIFEKVKDMEHTALRVIREPNQSKKQPAPKIIVVVKNNELAQLIKEKCLSLISSTNESIRKELADSVYLHYELKYSINIISSESDIVLSVHSAQRRKKMDGIEIKSKLEQLQEKLGVKQDLQNILLNTQDMPLNANIKYIDKCINKIDDKKDYILAESTGSSYRITYFDGERRQQISVGNLLIVVSSSDDIQILDAPTRKQRSDKKDWLYCLGDEYDMIYIYPA